MADPGDSDFPEPSAARAAFARVDGAVEASTALSGVWTSDSNAGTERFTGQFTARRLLCPPVTHEFNHKGQILLALRLSGVDPGDTDLIHPFQYWPSA